MFPFIRSKRKDRKKSKIGEISKSDVPAKQPPSVIPHAVSSDVPIKNGGQDLYGVNGFARAIARSVLDAEASEGLVFAVNGAWGSGKSSVCNLVLGHLKGEIDEGEIVPILFNPWWFSGGEALTISFFQELSVPIGKAVSDQAREALASLGRRVSSVGPLLEPIAAGVFGAIGAGKFAQAAAEVASKLAPERTVEEEHEKLSAALRDQNKKFLVIIDDIDRLGTDESLDLFKLVKSVGRLPNVIYLLAFDRQLAERMISERFPSEGVSYMEKLIQYSFDIPVPDSADLQSVVFGTVNEIMGGVEKERQKRFFNIFFDVCAPLLKVPRDAVRLSNAIKVSWPPVQGNVDKADFMGLETLRLFIPSVHSAIRSHPEMLCDGPGSNNYRNRQQEEERYNKVFLLGLEDRERQIAQRAIRRLFPRTDNIWASIIHTGDRHRVDKRVCSSSHFFTYFNFSLSEETVGVDEFQELLNAAVDVDQVANLFLRAASQFRRKGGTRAALLLEELRVRAETIPEDHIENIVTGLFRIADAIDLQADEARGFSMGSNPLRIYGVLGNLVTDRLVQDKRDELFLNACRTASLGWILYFSYLCGEENRSNDGEREDLEPLVSGDVASDISKMALEHIHLAVKGQSLAQHRRIVRVLLRWDDLAPGEALRWTDGELENDAFVVSLSGELISRSWSQGMGFDGDAVATMREYVNFSHYKDILDAGRFRARVQQLLAGNGISQDDRQKLERFVATPDDTPD